MGRCIAEQHRILHVSRRTGGGYMQDISWLAVGRKPPGVRSLQVNISLTEKQRIECSRIPGKYFRQPGRRSAYVDDGKDPVGSPLVGDAPGALKLRQPAGVIVNL